MMTHSYQLTCISEPEQNRAYLSDLEEAAELCDLHPEMIEEFLRGRLLHAVENKQGNIYFDSSSVSRLRHIAYLREHEQIKFRTIRDITNMLDSLEAHEKELRERLRSDHLFPLHLSDYINKHTLTQQFSVLEVEHD